MTDVAPSPRGGDDVVTGTPPATGSAGTESAARERVLLTVQDMLSALAFLGFGLLGVLMAFTARPRVSAQPVDVNVDAELDLITACLAYPGLARALHDHEDLHMDGRAWLTPESFTGDRGEVWAQLLTDTSDPVTPTQQQLELAITVGLVAADRELYRGHATLTETGDPAAPLRWVAGAPSRARLLITFAITGLLGAVLAPLAASAGGVWGVLGLAVWLGTGALLAWVDRDTLCIDLPIALAGYATAIGAIILGVGLEGTVITAAIVAGAFTFLVGGFTLLYRLVRKVTGLGTGDLIMLPALVFVPIALGAPVEVTAWGLLAAGVIFIVESVIVRRGTGSPSAFGPALIVGYPLAWALMALLSVV